MAVLAPLRYVLVVLIAVLVGWLAADVRVHMRVSVAYVLRDPVGEILFFTRGILPFVLVVVLGMLAARVDARLRGRLCTRSMFRSTLAVAVAFSLGAWFVLGAQQAIVAFVADRLDFNLVLARPFLQAIFAGWMLIVLRRAIRRVGTPGRCVACGYDVTATVTGRCPECGHAV